MGQEVQIRIDSLDLVQVLDELRSRQESWENTAIFLRDDYFPDDAFVCEQCRDAHEAEKIANQYKRIISSVEQQIATQGR